MKQEIRSLCEEVVRARKICNIGDLVASLPEFMCHINQEPKIFDTYVNARDKSKKARYKKYSKLITYKSVEDYLNSAIANRVRLPASCREFALVAAHLGAHILQQEVYFIGKVNPRYARINHHLTRRKHCLNAYKEGDLLIFFDASVYKSISTGKKWIKTSEVSRDFNPSDIDFDRFIKYKGWLQEGRKITKEEIDLDYKVNKNKCSEDYAFIIEP